MLERLERLTGGGTEVSPGIIGTVRTARLRGREIGAREQELKTGYRLLSVEAAVEPPIATADV